MNVKALLCVALLGGCSMARGPVQAPLPVGASYVALGSSFAAGSGITPTKSDSGRCGRSELNYATLLAARLKLALDDKTCGGATTANILERWNELPAQIDAMTPQTRLVTVTIGGNDLGYAKYMILSSCGADGMSSIFGGKRSCPPATPPTPMAYSQLAQSLEQVIRGIKARAPAARIIFVQYVQLAPEHPCANAEILPANVAVARKIGEQLAMITARVAKQEGAEVLPVDAFSKHHTACDDQPWSSGTKVPTGDGTFWHPNVHAHASIAQALAARLDGIAKD